MTFRYPFLILLLLISWDVCAQETFVPPEAYPVDRYESGWMKNPFTLKTAPVAIAKDSFAKDLVLGSMYQVDSDITVIVVNTKTRERTSLKNQQPASNGMRVKEAALKDTKKESYVIVESAGEEATLHYDDAFLKQMVASNSAATNPSVNVPAKQPARLPAMPQTSAPGMPPGVPMPGSNKQQAPPMPGAEAPAPPNLPPGYRPPETNSGQPAPTINRRRMLTAPAPL